MKTIINTKTGEQSSRPLTPEEQAQRDSDAAEDAAYKTPAARAARITQRVNQTFTNPDPENEVLVRIVFEMAKDIANARGLSLVELRDDYITRALS